MYSPAADAASSNSTPPRSQQRAGVGLQGQRGSLVGLAQDAVTPAADKGVCIINAAVENSIETTELASGGYKVRKSATCLPDVLVTGGKGSTIAFIALDSSLPLSELQKPGSVMERIDLMHIKGFPCAYVIVLRYDFRRNDGLAQMLIDAACKYQGKPAVVHAAPTASFSQAVLDICSSIRSEQCQPQTIEEKAGVVTNAETNAAALMNIPGLKLLEDEALELCKLGSLRHIADSSVEDIALCTDISRDRAGEIVTFFTMTHQ